MVCAVVVLGLKMTVLVSAVIQILLVAMLIVVLSLV